MDQHTLLLAAVPVVGLVAGFINTLAGSGSLLSLPMLILLGLPANVANGTNRVGVTMQNIVAVATFCRSRAPGSSSCRPSSAASSARCWPSTSTSSCCVRP
jgi:uncharacterized membrane protein YfcA